MLKTRDENGAQTRGREKNLDALHSRLHFDLHRGIINPVNGSRVGGYSFFKLLLDFVYTIESHLAAIYIYKRCENIHDF